MVEKSIVPFVFVKFGLKPDWGCIEPERWEVQPQVFSAKSAESAKTVQKCRPFP